MTVYVDDMNLRADVSNGTKTVRGRWSHLFADTEQELRAFATRIGLKPDWIQHPGESHAHFDVTGRMRQRAIAAGATPVTWQQAGEFFAERSRQARTQPGDQAAQSPPASDSRSAPTDADRAALVRQAAHFYLGHGLLPVPGWATTPGGACACLRGAACPRPGKHPRAVHTGPGPHDYSWKPLACHTHDQVDQRFAPGGDYPGANLMLAIPAGMLVIDQDDDDGGPQAIATLATQLGHLPATLAHRTPHGVHRIYRTPPGWTGRAWVGKDTHNPLPPGIDLRVPGQILMAPPSQVPAEDGLATYGPTAQAAVAELPAAYLAAWTPPQPQPAPAPRPVPVPPSQTDTAAACVHAKVEGVIADLAAHQPGGRNTAIYTAALKVGSTLGAARTTPGAEHAADRWTGQAAEDALMVAAETNGYIAEHGPAMARSAIRSGLRNGLRQPRPLPDFTPTPATTPNKAEKPGRRRDTGQTQHTPAAASPATATKAGGSSTPPGVQPRRQASTARRVSAVLRAAGYPAGIRTRGGAREGYQVQPRPDGGLLIRHIAADEPIDGVSPSARIERMLAHYGHALTAAGYQVTAPTPNTVAVTPPEPESQPAQPPAADDKKIRASEAAAAASQAYRAGDFGRARQLIGQAADLDPVRAGLWEQHRREITAKELFTQAKTARSEGGHDRAAQLMTQARELDPRMAMLWDRHLTATRTTQPTRQAPSRQPERSTAHRGGSWQPATKRGTGNQPGGQHDAPAPAEPHQAQPSTEAASRPAAGSGGGAGEKRVRHAWEPTGGGAKRCTRDGCGLVATQRPHPTERRWLTTYSKEGTTITAERVPGCGQPLPPARHPDQARQLATEADRHAGCAFRAGDIDRAYRLLTDARVLDPDRQPVWDQHEAQIRAAVTRQQPRQVSKSTETAACPQCGSTYQRPTGETYPCLSCETQARLKAAGFTPQSPELKKVADWNRETIPSPGHSPETPQPSPQQQPQDTPVPGDGSQVKTPEREKEACD